MLRRLCGLLALLPLILAAAPPADPPSANPKIWDARIRYRISSFGNQRMQTIPGTAFVYGTGDTIWVQRTANPEQIDDTDTLVTNRFNASQLCRFDVMTTIDRFNGFFTGAVFFEDFVPYTRKGSKDAGEG